MESREAELFQGVEDRVQQALGVDAATMARLAGVLGGASAVDGSGEEPVEIVTDDNGHGTLTTKSKNTWYVTISDPVHITDPDGGTWHVKVTDAAQEGRLVFEHKAMEKCKDYHYSYKTGFSCQLRIEVWWSEKRKTTFKADIKYSY